MFLNRQTLKDGLFGLVGFHNANNPSYPNLTPSLLESRSHTYYNDANSLLGIENIDQSIKNFSAYNYTPFSTETRDAGGYAKGSKVVFSSVNYEYISNTPSTGLTPNPNADVNTWVVIDSLSDYLTKAVYSGIDRMCDKYMNSKKMRERSKSIFENVLLYNGGGDVSDLEVNRDRFVGIRLRFKKREKHLITIMNKIGHQFTGAFEGLEIKVYHESQQEPIATYTINHTKPLSFQWTNLTQNNHLNYVDDYDAGGDFYIGYKQSDLEALEAQAVNKNMSFDSAPITSDDVWRSFYFQYSNYIDIMGFSVEESYMIDDKMFDTKKVVWQPFRTYGLNFNLTLDTDLTPFFLQEESIVANALKFNVAMVLMESLAYNVRGGNQVATQVRALAEKQLFHHEEAFGTLADQCREANDDLSFDFSSMDNAVMPSDNKFKIKSRRGSL